MYCFMFWNGCSVLFNVCRYLVIKQNRNRFTNGFSLFTVNLLFKLFQFPIESLTNDKYFQTLFVQIRQEIACKAVKESLSEKMLNLFSICSLICFTLKLEVYAREDKWNVSIDAVHCIWKHLTLIFKWHAWANAFQRPTTNDRTKSSIFHNKIISSFHLRSKCGLTVLPKTKITTNRTPKEHQGNLSTHGIFQMARVCISNYYY